MLTKQIELNEVHNLEELIAQLSEDTDVLLMRGNTPIARLSAEQPPAPRKKRKAGLHAGEMWMADDFNAELPDSFWFGEE